MRNLMRYFLTIVAAFTAVVSGGKSFACPYLIRPNNKWEIGEFFGTWSAIESFSHVANETTKDVCASLQINEVNDLHEAMTYGRPADPFNFQYTLRYLRLKFTNNLRVTEHFVTFNNSNQMLWKSTVFIVQVIKFDRNQLLLTVCEPKDGLFYSLLLARRNHDEIASDTSTKLNHLVLRGRNLNIHSRFTCDVQQIEAIETIHGSSNSRKFNFNNSFSMAFLLSVLILL